MNNVIQQYRRYLSGQISLKFFLPVFVLISFFSPLTHAAPVIGVDDSIVVDEDSSTVICQLDNDMPAGNPTPLVTLTGSQDLGGLNLTVVKSVAQIDSATCSTSDAGMDFNAYLLNLEDDQNGSGGTFYYGAYDSAGGNFDGANCSAAEGPGSETDSCGTVTITVNAVDDPAIIVGVIVGAVTEDNGPNEQVSRDLNHTDVDNVDDAWTPQVNTVGKYGRLDLTAAGVWKYTLNDSDADT
ncbi:MAG: hypothetical protein HOE54_12710, partial [Gammaproteobacteria bacterium]|nr:hypothetical protein [Gammaproteobacteria bacterium]